jgi:hypothetical protein
MDAAARPAEGRGDPMDGGGQAVRHRSEARSRRVINRVKNKVKWFGIGL